MSAYALEFALDYYYFDQASTPFFENLSFKLEPGKLHNLKGKNGSGKSTLFSLLKGSRQERNRCQGYLTVHQKTYSLNQACSCPNIALVNQRFDSMIADQFTFLDNLKFASFSPYPSFNFIRKPLKLASFLDQFNIPFSVPVHLLSGGQRQILAFSMVLQKNPSILLLDEPTATLDPINARLTFQFLQHLAQKEKLTILMISHDSELVGEFCDGLQLELTITSSGLRTCSQVNLK